MTSIEGVVLKQLRTIPDERGWLMEILRADDPFFTGFGQVYMTAVYPGVVKAWHMHENQFDNVVCVSGNIRLGLFDARDGSPTRGKTQQLFLGETNRTLVHIPPGVFHGFQCLGPETAVVLNVPDKPYNYEDPDEVRRPAHDPDIPFSWEILDR